MSKSLSSGNQILKVLNRSLSLLKFLGQNDPKKVVKQDPKSFGYRCAQPKVFGSEILDRYDPKYLGRSDPKSYGRNDPKILIQQIRFGCVSTPNQRLCAAAPETLWIATTQTLWVGVCIQKFLGRFDPNTFGRYNLNLLGRYDLNTLGLYDPNTLARYDPNTSGRYGPKTLWITTTQNTLGHLPLKNTLGYYDPKTLWVVV